MYRVPPTILSSLRSIHGHLARLGRVTCQSPTAYNPSEVGAILNQAQSPAGINEAGALELLEKSPSLRAFAWMQAVNLRYASSVAAAAQMEQRVFLTGLQEPDSGSHAYTILGHQVSLLEKRIEEHLIDEVMRWVPCAPNNCTLTVRAPYPTPQASQWAAQLANMYAANAARNDFHVDETFDRSSGLYSIRIQTPHASAPAADPDLMREWCLFPTGWYAHETGVHARVAADGSGEDLAIVKVVPHERVVETGRLQLVNMFDVLQIGGGLMHLPTGWSSTAKATAVSHDQQLQELESMLQSRQLEEIKDHSRFTLLMRQATGITAAHGPVLRKYLRKKIADQVSGHAVEGFSQVSDAFAGGVELDALLGEAVDHFAERCTNERLGDIGAKR